MCQSRPRESTREGRVGHLPRGGHYEPSNRSPLTRPRAPAKTQSVSILLTSALSMRWAASSGCFQEVHQEPVRAPTSACRKRLPFQEAEGPALGGATICIRTLSSTRVCLGAGWGWEVGDRMADVPVVARDKQASPCSKVNSPPPTLYEGTPFPDKYLRESTFWGQ